jgi:hypothetical protein
MSVSCIFGFGLPAVAGSYYGQEHSFGISCETARKGTIAEFWNDVFAVPVTNPRFEC